MDKLNKTHIGFITLYVKAKRYGFIESGDHNYFFFDNYLEHVKHGNNGETEHVFRSGDEVEFKLKLSPQKEGKVEAYDLKFIRNIRLQELLDEAKTKGVLQGHLKIFDTKRFFVQHLTTNVYVPIKVDVWELDIHDVYIERKNQLVEFRLSPSNNMDRKFAQLTDRKFPEIYWKILDLYKTRESTLATIKGKDYNGLIVTIFDDKVDGLIKQWKDATPKETEKFLELEEGETALVKVKYWPEEKQVKLKLAIE